MVEELLDRGAAKVYATARSPHMQADQRIVPLVLDVTDEDSVAAAAQAATDVSIVVNNAGISLNTPVLDAPLALRPSRPPRGRESEQANAATARSLERWPARQPISLAVGRAPTGISV
jgi:NAD(P)-dependent dehydrogenase (short-subunit alcohol dehydrogenase family)